MLYPSSSRALPIFIICSTHPHHELYPSSSYALPILITSSTHPHHELYPHLCIWRRPSPPRNVFRSAGILWVACSHPEVCWPHPAAPSPLTASSPQSPLAPEITIPWLQSCCGVTGGKKQLKAPPTISTGPRDILTFLKKYSTCSNRWSGG